MKNQEKNPKKFFDYNLDFDITSNKQEVDITGKTDLVTPTWKIRQTFNEGNVNKSKFSKDFYLGDLETESKYIIIKCRDHEYVDGDKIRLMLNGSVIHPNITLSSVFYVVDVDLVIDVVVVVVDVIIVVGVVGVDVDVVDECC